MDGQVLRSTSLDQFQFQTALRRIKTRVKESHYWPRCSGKNISSLLDDDNLCAGKREPARNRTADNTRTDDGDVKYCYESLSMGLPLGFRVRKRVTGDTVFQSDKVVTGFSNSTNVTPLVSCWHMAFISVTILSAAGVRRTTIAILEMQLRRESGSPVSGANVI